MNRTLAAIVVAAAISTGCGSNAATDTTRTAAKTNTSTTSTSHTTAKKLTAQEKAVKFSECIRANGVPHFPDPDPKGDFNFGIDVSRNVWLKAVDACKALKPPGALSSRRSPKQESAALRFAACVRENGVKDFPDPVNGEPMIDTYKIPSSNRPGGMAVLNAAVHKCAAVLRQAAGGQG